MSDEIKVPTASETMYEMFKGLLDGGQVDAETYRLVMRQAMEEGDDITAQMKACLRGEHEEGRQIGGPVPILPVCRWCRCLYYVERP